jgi:hypothetical protein
MEVSYSPRACILWIILFTIGVYKAQAQNTQQAQLGLKLEAAWRQADAYNKAVLGQQKQVAISQELVKNRRS